MTAQQAVREGYHFHGCYERSKGLVKEKAAELRALGNKAVVVTVPDNPLSRGPKGTGYSVYWIESEKNIKEREAKAKADELIRLKIEVNNLNAKLCDLRKQLAELEEV